jgi:hypothetical protein
MLNLTPTEMRVVKVWSEKGASSPFPQEMGLLSRIKSNVSNREMQLNRKELEIVLHWADLETKGHHGTDRFLLEQEQLLLDKIENYLKNSENRSLSP